MRRGFGRPSVPVPQQDLAAWRREIVDYRLPVSENMAPPVARAYWAIIDVIEACIKLSGADFEEQMELVDREVEERFTRPGPGKLRRRLELVRAGAKQATIHEGSSFVQQRSAPDG